MKILAIGNSFSQDATAYLHAMAACANLESLVVNLCIGGCSLERHVENIKSDACVYGYERNGAGTGRSVSIKEVLLEENWDVVTMQQASPYSGLLETYFPYIEQLSAYIRQYQPNAKQMIHQTWAYEHDCSLEFFHAYDNNQLTMYHALKNAYEAASTQLQLPLIPSGEVIQTLRAFKPFDYKNGGLSLCKDGFHMNVPYGRYAVAATWYQSIFHLPVSANRFIPPDVDADGMQLIAYIKKVVDKVTL